MDIANFINSGANIVVQVTTNDLKEFAMTIANEIYQKPGGEDRFDEYLTPKQVSEKYGVDISTLWRWAKKEYLTPCELGGKRYYRVSDIETLMKKGRR